jgi:hypothetical protein
LLFGKSTPFGLAEEIFILDLPQVSLGQVPVHLLVVLENNGFPLVSFAEQVEVVLAVKEGVWEGG